MLDTLAVDASTAYVLVDGDGELIAGSVDALADALSGAP